MKPLVGRSAFVAPTPSKEKEVIIRLPTDEIEDRLAVLADVLDRIEERLADLQDTVHSTRPDDLALLDKKQLAEILGCSTRDIDRMVKAGDLPSPFRLHSKGRLRWQRTDVVAWLEDLKGRAS